MSTTRKIRKKRYSKKEFIEDIKLTLGLMFFMIVIPMAMFIHWLAFGYGC